MICSKINQYQSFSTKKENTSGGRISNAGCASSVQYQRIWVSGSACRRGPRTAHSAPHTDANYYSIFTSTKTLARSVVLIVITSFTSPCVTDVSTVLHLQCILAKWIMIIIFPELCLRQLLLLIHCFFFPWHLWFYL